MVIRLCKDQYSKGHSNVVLSAARNVLNFEGFSSEFFLKPNAKHFMSYAGF